MRRNRYAALVVAVMGALWCASASAADGPVRTYLSAPGSAATGEDILIEALIVNTGDSAVTFGYEASVEGLTVDETALKRRVWLAAKTVLPVEWHAAADKEGEAKFSLAIDDRPSAECRLSVVAGPAGEHVMALVQSLEGRLIVEMPEAGRAFALDVTLTSGAVGELESTLAGLRNVSGFSTSALIARGIAPAALGKAERVPELDVLYAVQDSSGGWGAAPMAAPEAAATSRIVFWLGLFAEAGGEVNAPALDAALGYLRKELPNAGGETRAWILAALAANGKATEEDLASISKEEAAGLSLAGQILAECAGADVARPGPEELGGLDAFEMSLVVALVPPDKMHGPGPDLQRLVMLRGPAPRFDTQEAAMYALALKTLVAGQGVDGSADVDVRLDMGETREVTLDAKGPWDRFSLSTTAEPGKKKTLAVRGDGGSNVFCRVVVRRANRTALPFISR